MAILDERTFYNELKEVRADISELSKNMASIKAQLPSLIKHLEKSESMSEEEKKELMKVSSEIVVIKRIGAIALTTLVLFGGVLVYAAQGFVSEIVRRELANFEIEAIIKR